MDQPAEPAERKPAGFWASLKAAGEKAAERAKEAKEKHAEAQRREDAERGHPPLHKMLQLKFLTGPLDLTPNSTLFLHIADGNVLLFKQRLGFTTQCDEEIRIPLASIKHMELETAERMTAGRAAAGYLLAGPLGAAIGGFGFKKKDKFLRIDFNDAGMESSIVFGEASEQANNKILAARREAAAAAETASHDAE